jgi:hypothetical protein
VSYEEAPAGSAVQLHAMAGGSADDASVTGALVDELACAASGRRRRVWSAQPGVQIYTLNWPPRGGETGMRLITPDGTEHPWRRVIFAADERRFLEFVIPAGPAGDVVMEFDTALARPVPGDERPLSLLLHALMLCADHDLQRAYEYLGDRLQLARLA